ncbi:MAG: hypothetical protein GVY13_12685 [Alphaproteobacteria bacterium]|nr:hypothetical protein [Alphaproteobacteria bacterium]
MSHTVAVTLGAEFHRRGLEGARPVGADPGHADPTGTERRMAGGIGAKKVDVTWATEESGLLLGISIKTINFRDSKTGNFQKNLTNRRGDMLFEAVTLHRRFPYSVLGGLFFLDAAAAHDATGRRRSTFLNAHARLRLFTGRNDPGGRDEQYESLYIVLLEASAANARIEITPVGQPEAPVSLETAIETWLHLTAIRNPDFYEYEDGCLRRVLG